MAAVLPVPVESPTAAIWNRFCLAHRIARNCVPLFDENGLIVNLETYGLDRRLILKRSRAMESLLINAALKACEPGTAAQGVLYMMLWLDGADVVPLYIGKAERTGRNGGLSANLANVATDRSKFCRWGSNYAYHIGDLSAVVCPGHDARRITPKYERWAEALFVNAPSLKPALRRRVMFWATSWSDDSPSIWQELGMTDLAFQEYLLIGVASRLFPQSVLNDEGVNRKALVRA